MKTFLAAFSILFLATISIRAQQPTTAANALRLDSRDPVNAFLTTRYLVPPPSSASAFVVFDGTSIIPRFAVFDPVFKYTTGSPNNPMSIDFTGLTLSNYGLGSAASQPATAFQPASSYLDELVALGQNPDRAVRTDGSGDFVSETPTNFLAWLNGVSTSGSYANPSWLASLDWSKITGAPSIPAAQVNSDWNSVSGVSQILNKPVLGTAAAQNTTAFATAAQGSLAASALQPGANNSLLNNNAGYVTAVTAPVTSVNSQTGSVVLTKSSVGLGNVDNTSDLAKPISTATATALSGKFNNPSGTISQYLRGDGSLDTFPTNLNSFTNGPGFITGINSSMVTTALGFNPVSQGGARNAITLTTVGSSGSSTYNSTSGVLNIPNYTPAAFNFAAPVAGISLSTGVSFQPRVAGPCQIVVNTNVSGLIGVGGTITIATSPNSGGPYTTVATDGVAITILGIGDRASCLIPVPTGYWVRVTNTPSGLATITNTYTRWDVA